MNPFVVELVKDELSPKPDLFNQKFVIEDNVGEGIHIHYRNMRFEMSISEFEEFSNGIENALEELEKWE